VKEKVDFGVTLLLAIAAIGVLANLAFGGGSGPEMGPDRLDDWELVSRDGIWFGGPSAPVVVTAIIDFQCPFCAEAHPLLERLVDEYPSEVALAVHHLPLSIHPQATQAAVAVECADEQGRGLEYMSGLFDAQSEFAKEPWVDVATASGVPTPQAFQECIHRDPESFPRIRYGAELAEERRIIGAPVIYVNGARVDRASLASTVEDEVERARRSDRR